MSRRKCTSDKFFLLTKFTKRTILKIKVPLPRLELGTKRLVVASSIRLSYRGTGVPEAEGFEPSVGGTSTYGRL